MKKDSAYMERTVDFRKMWLLTLRRIWLFVAIILAAVAFCMAVYGVGKVLTYEGRYYCVSSDYYITFNLDEYENGVDYYNAYTWDSILRDDPIVDEVMGLLPKEYTREEVKAAVTGEMLGDYRILTVNCVHEEPTKAEAIADAYEIALALFADKIDMLDTIEVWSREECVPVKENNLIFNAAFLGLIIGVVLAGFVIGMNAILDDGIYVENDFIQRFDIPYLGMITQKGCEKYKQELLDNMSYLMEEGDYYLVSVEGMTRENPASKMQEWNSDIKGMVEAKGETLNTLRDCKGVIILLPWGEPNGNRCNRLIEFLKKQDCKIAGAVITNANDGFLYRYYWGKKQKTRE